MTTIDGLHATRIQELLTCAICLDHYQDPRRLPCSHTFCLSCIDKGVQNGSFTCPLQDNTKIDEKNIAQLPINRTIEDIIEFVSSANLSPDNKSNYECENCNENQATNWCEKCGSHFCQACTESIHSIKIFQSHVIIPSGKKIQSFCTDHSDEKFKYWCKKCEVLVCRDCLLFQHKDHTFSTLKEAASEAKTKFQEIVPEIGEIKRNLTMFSETTKNIIIESHEIAQQQKQCIEQTFANLQHMLEERKLAVIKQLEENNLQTINLLNERQNSIDQHLNLTVVQELCLKKILDSDDPMRILKFKSTLSHNYKDFTEQYQKIDEGYTIAKHMFVNDNKDVEQISGIITKFGKVKSKSYTIKSDLSGIGRINISKPDGETKLTEKSINHARGYKFSLKQPFQLRSIRIQSDYIEQHIGFVANDAGVVISNGTVHSSDSTMKWLTIPLTCEIRNNYSVLVWASSGNGSYAYKQGNNAFRAVNEDCSVKSRYITTAPQTTIGSTCTISANSYSIDMILKIED